MKYRTLGKTGLQVSVLGFGCGPLGSAYGNVSEDEGIRAVHRAIDLGINFFDVSPFYGITRAETILGKALSTHKAPRSSYYIATKVGRYGDDEFDFSAERVTKEFENSLKRLQTNYVDVLHCHDIEYGDLEQVINETIPALRKLQQSGKIRHVGITGFPLKIFEKVVPKTELDCILSYSHYSLNDSSLENIMPLLKAHKVGIISAAPLSQGLLTEVGCREWHASPPALREVSHCKSKGKDISRLALQFAVSNEEIATTLVGISSCKELEENVACIEEPMDHQLLQEVQQILKPVHNLTWQLGKPENN